MKKQYLGMSQVSSTSVDGEVAQYILSEIANGNPEYLKALAQIANSAVNSNGQQFSETDAQNKEKFFSDLWEKIKNIFRRKKDAEASGQNSTSDAKQLNAEVSAYLRA